MHLAALDIAVVLIYAVGIFAAAQFVSRERSHTKTSTDYFLASKTLPWWAVGTSLIAANISAEQIIGMSGSGYAIGIGIASYEWMAAITLIIVAKFFMPVFLRNGVTTMPHFLEQRYGPAVRTLMAVFWLGVYVFVNLTSILWLGAIAVHAVAGVPLFAALVGLGLFALTYQLYGGLKAVALTDFIQVTLLICGGLIIDWIALHKIGNGAGLGAGFHVLTTNFPEKFHMILPRSNPHYKELPGIAVLVGGLWVMNLSYWGFNQYIVQRALAAKSIREAQTGIALAAYLKLVMPIVVVLPGIAALVLAPDITRPDQAYPDMMKLLPTGLKGLVFAGLIAAIIASLASKVNSISTIFTLDLYARLRKEQSQSHLVLVGRIAAAAAMAIGILAAQPLLGNFDQAFQYIQDFTGYFTPGIAVIFLLGVFWKGATTAGALTAALGSVILSVLFSVALPSFPFMNRIGVVFLLTLAAAIAVSLVRPARTAVSTVRFDGVTTDTSAGFNIAAIGIIVVLVALYATWW